MALAPSARIMNLVCIAVATTVPVAGALAVLAVLPDALDALAGLLELDVFEGCAVGALPGTTDMVAWRNASDLPARTVRDSIRTVSPSTAGF